MTCTSSSVLGLATVDLSYDDCSFHQKPFERNPIADYAWLAPALRSDVAQGLGGSPLGGAIATRAARIAITELESALERGPPFRHAAPHACFRRGDLLILGDPSC